MYCPKWVIAWILLSALICTWDAGFVLMRPRSMPGGDLHKYWKPYALYITVDKLYGDMKDKFVYYQSVLNVCEVLLNFVSFFLIISSCNKCKLTGTFLALITQAFTFWKTVLYTLYDESYASHNDWNTFIFLYLIPNSIWLIVPFFSMIAIPYRLSKFLNISSDSKCDSNQIKTDAKDNKKKND